MKRANVTVRPGSQRSGWVKAIGTARWVGQAAIDGAAVDAAVFDLRHELRGLEPIGFADVAASSLLACEGFLKWASAFCNAAGPRRTTFAPALVACAKALDDVMGELRTVEASRSYHLERD
jgi:hypothetical protein